MESTAITSPFVNNIYPSSSRKNTTAHRHRSRSMGRDGVDDDDGDVYHHHRNGRGTKKDKKHRSSSRGRDDDVIAADGKSMASAAIKHHDQRSPVDTRGIAPPPHQPKKRSSPSALALGESARLAREGSASCVLGNELVVCGGAAAFGENPSDSLLLTSFRRLIKLNMLAAEWGHMDTYGEVPLPRTHHSICGVQGGSKLVLTGGELISPKVIAGPLAASPIKSPRFDHHQHQSFSSSSHLPMGRSLAPPTTTTMITSSYSPKSAPTLSYFELDVLTGEWKSFETFGDVPHNRSHHTTSTCGSTIVLLGGKPVLSSANNSSGHEVVVSTTSLVEMRDVGFYDVFVLHLSCRVWQRVETGRLDPSASPMLWGHSATNVGRQYIALYGGFDVSAGLPISGFNMDSKKSSSTIKSTAAATAAPVAELSNDVYVLDTETMLWERVHSGNNNSDSSHLAIGEGVDEDDTESDADSSVSSDDRRRRDGKTNTKTQTAAPSKPWAATLTKSSPSSRSPSPATHSQRRHHAYQPYHSPQTPSFYHGAVREDAERVLASTSGRKGGGGGGAGAVLQEMTGGGYLVDDNANVPLWGPARQLHMDLGRAVATTTTTTANHHDDDDLVNEGDALSNDYDDDDVVSGGGDGFEEDEGALAARAKMLRKASRHTNYDDHDDDSSLQPPPPSFGHTCLLIPNSEEILVLGGWAVNPNCTIMLSAKERAKRHKKQQQQHQKQRSSSSSSYVQVEEPLLRSLSDPYVFNLQTRKWRRITCPSSDAFSGDVVACVHGQHIISLKTSLLVYTLDCSPIPTVQGWQRYPSSLSPDLQAVRVRGYESSTSPASLSAEYYGGYGGGKVVASPDNNNNNQSPDNHQRRHRSNSDDGKARDWGLFNVEALTHGSRRPVDQSIMNGYRNPNLPLPARHYHGEVVVAAPTTTSPSHTNANHHGGGGGGLGDAGHSSSSQSPPSKGWARWPTATTSTGTPLHHTDTPPHVEDAQSFIRAAFESPYRIGHNNNNNTDAVEEEGVIADDGDEPDFSPFALRTSRSARGGYDTASHIAAYNNITTTSANPPPNRYVSPSSHEFVNVPPVDSTRRGSSPQSQYAVVEGRLLDSPPRQETAAPSPNNNTNNNHHHHPHHTPNSSSTTRHNMPTSTENHLMKHRSSSSSSSSALSATPYSQRVQQRFHTTTDDDAFGDLNNSKRRHHHHHQDNKHSNRKKHSSSHRHRRGSKYQSSDNDRHRSASPSASKKKQQQQQQRVKDLRSHRDRLEELRGRLEETQQRNGDGEDGAAVELPKDISKILKQMKRDSRKVELLIEELEVTRGLERVTSRGERLNDRSRSRLASRSVSPYVAVGVSGSGDSYQLATSHHPVAGTATTAANGGRVVDDEEASPSSYPTGGMASPPREQYYTHALGAVPVALRR